MPKKEFTRQEAIAIGKKIGVDWKRVDPEQLRLGLSVELEHGKVNPLTNITNDDLVMTGKIAVAHIMEIRNYYDLLDKMEKHGKALQKKRLEGASSYLKRMALRKSDPDSMVSAPVNPKVYAPPEIPRARFASPPKKFRDNDAVAYKRDERGGFADAIGKDGGRLGRAKLVSGLNFHQRTNIPVVRRLPSQNPKVDI